MNILKPVSLFCRDESGGLFSAELVLLATLLMGAVGIGASAAGTAITSELADWGAAIATLDQSFFAAGAQNNFAGASSQRFTDRLDDGDDGSVQSGANSRSIQFSTSSRGEGSVTADAAFGMGPSDLSMEPSSATPSASQADQSDATLVSI